MKSHDTIILEWVSKSPDNFTASELYERSVIEEGIYQATLTIIPVQYIHYERALTKLAKEGKIHHIGFKSCIYRQREKIYKKL